MCWPICQAFNYPERSPQAPVSLCLGLRGVLTLSVLTRGKPEQKASTSTFFRRALVYFPLWFYIRSDTWTEFCCAAADVCLIKKKCENLQFTPPHVVPNHYDFLLNQWIMTWNIVHESYRLLLWFILMPVMQFFFLLCFTANWLIQIWLN